MKPSCSGGHPSIEPCSCSYSDNAVTVPEAIPVPPPAPGGGLRRESPREPTARGALPRERLRCHARPNNLYGYLSGGHDTTKFRNFRRGPVIERRSGTAGLSGCWAWSMPSLQKNLDRLKRDGRKQPGGLQARDVGP